MTSIKHEQNNNNNNINKKKMNQTSSTSAETAATPLLLSFGLIADVQYCTHDDVWNFWTCHDPSRSKRPFSNPSRRNRRFGFYVHSRENFPNDEGS